MTATQLSSVTPAPTATAEARLAAFCAPDAPEVFHSIVYQPQVWTSDPYDVETIHAEARETFGRMLRRAAVTPPPQSGRILLLLGEAGSGKTHLMRAFRGLTHADGVGYFGYLQMNADVGNYARYLLSNLIESLDHPYHPPHVETSGLMRLSTGLFETIPGVAAEEREELRDGVVNDLSSYVYEFVDRAVSDRRFDGCDLDLIRALIYLQRDDPRIKSKVLKWLRCEDLSGYDRAMLGGLVPKVEEEHPLQMVTQFGRIMAAVGGAPLVLCVDQLEDMFNQNLAIERFRKVVDTLVAITDKVPTAVLVVACLEDYYKANEQSLTAPKLHRLTRDPEPVRLTTQRSLVEIETMVARRLEHLYDETELTPDRDVPTFPFQSRHLQPLTNLSARNALDNCRRHHQRCIAAGTWLEPDFAPQATEGPVAQPRLGSASIPDLEQIWNDFRTAFNATVPEDETGRAELLAWGIGHCSAELPPDYHFAAEADGQMIPVDGHSPGNVVDRLLVAVCEKKPQGGGLSRQITEVEKRAGETPIALVRSTEFPKTPKADVSKQIAKLIKHNGRRVVVEDSDWRTLLAFRSFHGHHGSRPDFISWQRVSQPLSKLPALRRILALDKLPAPRAAAAAPPAAPSPTPPRPVAPGTTAPREQPPTGDGPLLLGVSRSVSAAPVTVDPLELRQHMAFLGGPGSGKTTAALALIEQLLLRGVPAVLIDRKGDLCRYADPDAWRPPTDPGRAARLRDLRDCIDVAVYTPGAAGGRPLAIPVVPDGLSQLSTADREQVAGFAAAALGGMMNYKPKGTDQVLQVILAKAIEVLAATSGRPVTVEALQELVHDQDDALLNAVGGYEAKHYKRLAQDLLTLKWRLKNLLAADAEPLNIDALLGRGPTATSGKIRLSVISTHFLGESGTVDFWLAQLLIALDRWRVKSPSDGLQAVVLLDEADQYLPAQRQPATKAPLESLLRRARSAGIGFFLATQSPGDFDYRCRDQIRGWLVGRVKEPVALNKLKPMFSEAKGDVVVKLPTQGTGEFHLLREKEVVALKTEPSLIETKQLPEQRILEIARVGPAAAAGPVVSG
jgi:hypothetical protein